MYADGNIEIAALAMTHGAYARAGNGHTNRMTVDVQLCKSAQKVPTGDGWLFEIKYDGYRAILEANGNVRLFSRNGNDFTKEFAGLADEVQAWANGRNFTLDGELIVPDERGVSDFAALQKYATHGGALVYVAFDILFDEGEDLRALPLSERKRRLETLLTGAPPCLRACGYVNGRGKESYDAAVRLGLEGVVGKRIRSPYRGGRNDDWIKVKCRNEQEFVIGGYTRTKNKPAGISALLLGVWEDGTRALRYAGKTGTGWSRAQETKLLASFAGAAADRSPFASSPHIPKEEQAVWLYPRFIAQVRFAGFTESGKLRQPSFRGLRDDKAPQDVHIERIAVTHPQKIVYADAGITKGEIADYYEKVMPRMFPHVCRRLVSTVRCHDGVGNMAYFSRHPLAASLAAPYVDTADKKPYFYFANETALLQEVQLGALEFHTWGSRVDEIERPDTMIFDLDPDETLGLDVVREGVRRVRDVLQSLRLPALLKTSGGKGYHVTVPFAAPLSWEEFRAFAQGVARLLSEKHPDLFTADIRKRVRTHKIFLDWMRNARGATAVAPYSLRARPGAPVSCPIAWDELDTVAPNGITLFAALERLQDPDPWQ